MSVFYKIDSTHFSFREYWWGSRSPLVVFNWLIKLLRIPISGSMDDPPVELLQPHEVSVLPEDIQTKFRPLTEELAGLGFHSPVFHAIHDQFQNTEIYWATFCHASSQTFARIHHRIWRTPHPPRIYLFPVFVSAFSDGSFLVSSAGKADSLAPASVRTNRKLNASATDLWVSHQQELTRESAGKTGSSTATPDDVRAVAENYHAVLRNFHLRRKAFRPMSPTDARLAEAKGEIARFCESAGHAHAKVLGEMYQLQQKKPGWANGIFLLVVSLLVFLGAGSAQWSWKIAAALVPILLFHELGHYIAMRVFNYRNLRMFFIPFFGAAVSGQNYNVAGWKKALVSLMGPVPGIVVGTILGCAGLILHKTYLIKAASLALILNGFNLLPVLPLDGGWVMHAAMFSRHYVLDTAFRALAGAVLLIGGFLAKDKIFMFLGLFMLIGIPISFKTARIATELRRRGLKAASPDDQNIPPEIAQTIIGELKAAFPKGMTNKTFAVQALNIFETLNARPPGWLATISILGVHGAAFLLAVGFGIAFTVGGHGDLKGFAEMAASLPRHQVSCGSISTQKLKTDQDATAFNTIIATFPGNKEARRAHETLSRDLADNGTLNLFGDSVLLELPATDEPSRKRWVGLIQAQTTNLFVDTTNFHASFTLGCIAPNDLVAKAIVEELDDFFAASSSMHLIAPWTPSDMRSQAEREQHRIARRTYTRLQQNEAIYADPRISDLQKSIARAKQQGDPGEVKRLLDELHQLKEKLAKERLQNLRKENTMDLSVIDDYSALPRRTGTNSDFQLAMLQLGKKMGQLPLADARPTPIDNRFSTRWGNVSRQGLLLSLNYLSFERLSEGAPALVNWLCSKGCLDFKYSFQAGFGFDTLLDQ